MVLHASETWEDNDLSLYVPLCAILSDLTEFGMLVLVKFVYNGPFDVTVGEKFLCRTYKSGYLSHIVLRSTNDP